MQDRLLYDDSSAIKRACDDALIGPDDRDAVRLKVGFLRCNLGSVLDLSLAGMCVLSWRRLRGRHTVELYSTDNGVRIEAEVRRSQRVGFFKHEIALEFIDLSPEVAKALITLATKATA